MSMATDITELARRMSIERIKQIAVGDTPIVGEKERLAITALSFHHELKICTEAFQAAGLNQLKAEEALEKSQRANAAQDDHINQQQDRIEQLEKRNAELGKYAGKLETINEAAEKLVRCKGRYHSEQNYRALAALFGVNTPDLPPLDGESRTVTVHMPGSYQTSCSGSEKYLCPVDVEQAVLSAGADAGIKINIKWEAE